MEKEPKKHHYVPRSVLRSFSIGGARRSVFVFDKNNGRVFSSTVGNAAADNHFYRVDLGKHRINFEPLFQDLDDRLANLVTRLTTTPSLSALDSADRHDLAVVTACQLLRTPTWSWPRATAWSSWEATPGWRRRSASWVEPKPAARTRFVRAKAG